MAGVASRCAGGGDKTPVDGMGDVDLTNRCEAANFLLAGILSCRSGICPPHLHQPRITKLLHRITKLLYRITKLYHHSLITRPGYLDYIICYHYTPWKLPLQHQLPKLIYLYEHHVHYDTTYTITPRTLYHHVIYNTYTITPGTLYHHVHYVHVYYKTTYTIPPRTL